MKNSVKDELINKVYHLTNALNKAENLVNTLQQENENLKKLLEDMNIESEHHEYTLLGI
jgi:hypothetical protein